MRDCWCRERIKRNSRNCCPLETAPLSLIYDNVFVFVLLGRASRVVDLAGLCLDVCEDFHSFRFQ